MRCNLLGQLVCVFWLLRRAFNKQLAFDVHLQYFVKVFPHGFGPAEAGEDDVCGGDGLFDGLDNGASVGADSLGESFDFGQGTIVEDEVLAEVSLLDKVLAHGLEDALVKIDGDWCKSLTPPMLPVPQYAN